MPSHIKSVRLGGLPLDLRSNLIRERKRRGWTQRELGERSGLPQVHISGIETGKVVPRFDTLLDLVRILNWDLILVPRNLVPAVQALIRSSGETTSDHEDGEERSLYADRDDETQP